MCSAPITLGRPRITKPEVAPKPPYSALPPMSLTNTCAGRTCAGELSHTPPHTRTLPLRSAFGPLRTKCAEFYRENSHPEAVLGTSPPAHTIQYVVPVVAAECADRGRSEL